MSAEHNARARLKEQESLLLQKEIELKRQTEEAERQKRLKVENDRLKKEENARRKHEEYEHQCKINTKSVQLKRQVDITLEAITYTDRNMCPKHYAELERVAHITRTMIASTEDDLKKASQKFEQSWQIFCDAREQMQLKIEQQELISQGIEAALREQGVVCTKVYEGVGWEQNVNLDTGQNRIISIVFPEDSGDVKIIDHHQHASQQLCMATAASNNKALIEALTAKGTVQVDRNPADLTKGYQSIPGTLYTTEKNHV